MFDIYSISYPLPGIYLRFRRFRIHFAKSCARERTLSGSQVMPFIFINTYSFILMALQSPFSLIISENLLVCVTLANVAGLKKGKSPTQNPNASDFIVCWLEVHSGRRLLTGNRTQRLSIIEMCRSRTSQRSRVNFFPEVCY